MENFDKKRFAEIFEKLIPDKVSYEFMAFDANLTDKQLSEFRTQFPLSELEFLDIQRAIPKREIEYRTGRFLAKKLLGLNKISNKSYLYKKPNGAPNWPQQIIGSISHSESTCIVAITEEKLFSGIGIDIEHGIFEADLERRIVRHEEIVNRPDCLSPLAALRALFCCKEAVYKALERVLTERIDFLDVNICTVEAIDSDVYEFDVKFTRSIPCLRTLNPDRIYGRFYADEHYAVSVVILKLDAT